ncbi:MAG: hypothetical protein IJF18_07490 [Oscillospiraceae bacterium]|nr:hypothetical protein [Oscillospiraceae bacterium]
MKKKSLAKRLVSFITAVGLSLTSTVMLIPASAAVDEAHADCPGAGTVVWTETDTNHQLACNGDGCDYTEGESHTADYQWTVVNGTQHQLVCKGTGCTLVSGDAHDENTLIGTCSLCEEQTEVYTVRVASVEGGIITAAYGDTAIAENGSAEVEDGTEITLTASPDDGFVFANWVINDEEGAADTSTTITVNEAATVSAVFTAETSDAYSINLTITPEGAGEAWAAFDGDTVTEAEANSKVGLGYSNGSGYKFVEWRSDDVTVNTQEVDPTDGGPSFTHYFAMPEKNVNIEAVFEAIDYRIIVAGNGNGTVEIDGDITTANVGDTVKFTVTPNSGYGIGEVKYSYLENAAEEETVITLTSDEDGSYSFEMPAYDVTISVTYTAIKYGINLTITPEGAGEAWATINSATVTEAEANSNVGLGCSSGSGYKFVEWRSDDVTVNALEGAEPTGNGPSITHYFAMPEKNVNIEAVFEAIDYNIKVGESENGSITIANLPAKAKAGDYICVNESDVTADPDEGYALGDLYYSYTDENGEVVKAPVSLNYNFDIESYEYGMYMPAADVTITAEFVPAYSITIGEIENGSITIANLPAKAKEGDEIQINKSDVTADPDEGYMLDGLYYSYEKDGEAYKEKLNEPDYVGYYYFTMPAADVTITAEFVPLYSIKVGESENGSITIANLPAKAKADDRIFIYKPDITANPDKGYVFDGLNISFTAEDGEVIVVTANEGCDGDYYFTMPAADVTITAEFIPLYSIKVGESENGSITIANLPEEAKAADYSYIYMYIYDSDVTANPDKGYKLSGLCYSYVKDGETYKANLNRYDSGGYYYFSMPDADVTITAEFVKEDYNVTVTSNDETMGTASASVETAQIGDKVNIYSEPASEDYELAEWRIVKGDIEIESQETETPDGIQVNYYFTMSAEDVEIKAVFKPVGSYLIDAAETEHGTVTVSGSAKEGDTVEFTAVPDIGYEISKVSISYFLGCSAISEELEGENGNYSFTMPAADVIITAEIKAVNYTIETVKAGNGTVTADKETANYQDTVTFTAVPDEGYEITEVKYSYLVYDAAEDTVITLTPDEEGNYSFEMPAYNVVITVTFKAIEYSVKASEGYEGGMVTRDKTKAIIGETVTFTAKPDTSEYNYVIKDVKVTYTKNGVEETITPTKGEDGKYSFKMPAADVYIVVEFATYVFELYEDTEEGMVDLGFADTWEEIAELIEDGKYMIKVNKEYEFDTKFALPKTAYDLNFVGDGKLTFTGTKLVIPVDTVFQTEIAVSNSKNNLIDITVAKDKILILTQIPKAYEEPVQFINKITGTKTSSFASGGASVKVNNIATFGEVLGNITVNGGKATGIATFNGQLKINGTKATAAITDVVDGSSIGLVEENGVLPKVTIDNVVGLGKYISTPTIDVVVLGETELAELASGTTVLYSKNDIADNVEISNSTEDNKPLTAYYYPKTKEIKAEDGTALTLYKGTEASDSTKVGSYPNFELLFAEITDSTADYIIEVNAPITLDAKFALPKTAKSLTFTEGTAEDADGSLTFTGTKLIIPVNTTLDVGISASNKTNLIDVSVAKDVTLEITTNACIEDENGPVQFINKITGTKTSKLISGDVTVNNIATFEVISGVVMVNGGKVTGITNFVGQLVINGAKATVAITNVAGGSIIGLFEENGVLPKVTIDNVVGSGYETSTPTITVIVLGETGFAELSSGTTVLYSKNDIAENVKITNTTSDGEELTAYYYPKTKEIKAENGFALTLYKGVEEEEKELVGSYKNFDELFAEITDSTVDYTIEVNTDITLGTNFAFPKKAKSIVLKGVAVEQEYPALIHTSTKLVIPYNVFFDGIDNVVSNKNNLIDISVAKGATFGCGERGQFINPDGEVSINKITGTKTSHISGFVSANNISTFDTIEGIIGVIGKATGINKFGGWLIVSPEATVDITEIANNSMIGLASKNGVIPKVTLGEIGEPVERGITTVSVDIFDYETNEPVEIASGTPILYSKKANPDFTDKITIENNGGEMKAYAYGKTIKAEYADAVKVQIWNAETEEYIDFGDVTYSSFEAAVAAIDAERNSEVDYVITLNRDVTVEKFALPKYAKSVEITSNAETGRLCTINVGKATSITANTSLGLYEINFVTTGKSLTLNAKKNLNAYSVGGNVTAIKGSAKYTFTCMTDPEFTPDITGFGTVKAEYTFRTGKVFNVNKLVLNNCIFEISNVTTKASVKAIEVLNSGAIEYKEGAKTALTFTGKDEDFIGPLEIRGAVANGQTVLISDKVDVNKLTDCIIDPDFEIEYEFKRFGKEIRYMGKVLSVKSEVGNEFSNEYEKYSTWDDIVNAIETVNNAEAVYTIELLDNYNANGAIKFPKAGTYKQVFVMSENVEEREMYNFNFTGNLTLTSQAFFDFVNLGAVKNGEPAKYTIKGKDYLQIEDCNTGLLTSITGDCVSLRDDEVAITADKVKATDVLYLDGDIKVIGGVTAKELHICGNTNLVMNQGSKFTVTDKVKVYEDDYQLAVTILDKKTGEPASLNEGYVIGSVKGEDAENIVLNAEAHPNLMIENVNGKLIVKTALNDQ